MRTRSTMATAIAVALALMALADLRPAAAQPMQFQTSSKVSCWEDTAGFSANLQPLTPPGSVSPVNFSRPSEAANFTLVIFGLDGASVTLQGQDSTFRPTAANPFSESTFTCAGTFVFDPVTQRITVTTTSCTFQDTLPSPGSGTITGGVILYQATEGIALQLTAPHPPVVETVNVTTGPNAPYSYQRVCARAGTGGESLGHFP